MWSASKLRTRAGPGIMLAGTKTGTWGAATGLGQATAGNARRHELAGLQQYLYDCRGCFQRCRLTLPNPNAPAIEAWRF